LIVTVKLDSTQGTIVTNLPLVICYSNDLVLSYWLQVYRDTSKKTFRLIEIKVTRGPHIKFALHVALSSIWYFYLNKEKKTDWQKRVGSECDDLIAVFVERRFFSRNCGVELRKNFEEFIWREVQENIW